MAVVTKTSRAGFAPIKLPEQKEILDALPDAVLVLDAQGHQILFANLAAQELTGRCLSDLVGHSLGNLFPEGSTVLRHVRQSVTEGREINASDPQTGDMLIRPFGKGIILTLRAAGVSRQLAQQLAHRQMMRPIEAMSSQLAHEIKNPLSGIKGAAQLLEQALTSEEDRDLARLIQSEVLRIRRLVDRMDVFSATGLDIPHKPVNLHEVLRHVLAAARAGFASDVTIVEDYDPSLPEITGNQDQMVQVFMNLLKNAAEAAPRQGGEICVRSYFNARPVFHPDHARKLCVAIAIEDNGSGIAPDILSSLFNPFFTTKPQGSGLGLALTSRIVDDHGGITEVNSRSGKTIFTVFLPRGSTT